MCVCVCVCVCVCEEIISVGGSFLFHIIYFPALPLIIPLAPRSLPPSKKDELDDEVHVQNGQ